MLGRTVAELENTMSSSELTEWMEYYQIEPFGPFRDNLHSATIAMILANQGRGKRGRVATVDDFILKPKEHVRRSETHKALSWLRAVAKVRKKA